MGLLDGIIRTATRRAVSKAVDIGVEKAAEAIANNIQNNNNTPVQQTAAPVQQNAAPAQAVLETVNIFKPNDISANEVHFNTFASGANGESREFDCSVMLAEGYHQFDSGAGEIDFSATYLPNLTAGDTVCYNAARPALYSGEAERKCAEIINMYEKNGTVKAGCELYRVNSDLFAYKAAWSFNGTRTVCYCYKPCPSASYYAQLGAMYPDSVRGSETEALTLRQLNLMVATFTRTEK